MKNYTLFKALLLLCVFSTLIVKAQVSESVNVTTAGTLATLLTPVDLLTVTDLTITGVIDASDFKTMRDDMPELAIIDMSGAFINSYEGPNGTAYSDPGAAQVSSKQRIMDNASVQPMKMRSKTADEYYPINEVPQFAFCNPANYSSKLTLTEIILPTTAKSIGSNAFYRCSNLTSVTVPSSLTSIEYAAFRGCNGIVTFTIPAAVTSIGDQAFGYFEGELTVEEASNSFSVVDGVLFNKVKTHLLQCPVTKSGSYAIPASVTEVHSSAFESCYNLTSITIPATVTVIEVAAFFSCKGLTSMAIPAAVNSIGDMAFYSLNGPITVDPANNSYSSKDGVLFNKAQTQLKVCPISKTGTYAIPATVETIDRYAFTSCTKLTSISIPSSVINMNDFALQRCTGLTSIYAYGVTPVNLSSSTSVFIDINKSTCTLYVPVGSKAAYEAANQWKDFNNIVEIITGLEDKPLNGPIVHSVDGVLHIENAAINSTVKVYDISGRMLYSSHAQNSSLSVPLSKNAVYIVQINSKSYKVNL